MIKIKYNDSDIFYDVTFSRTEHTVTLKGDIPISNSGFTTYRMNGEQLGDFIDFNTVYRVGEGFVEYSNDGSVYEEPIQPTEEELKRNKIESEINAIKQELSTYDYIGTKIAMGVATKEEYVEKIAYTETLREKIRELEKQLLI